MQLETLKNILETELGLTQDNGCYSSKEGQQISFYVGKPGSAMVVSNVQSIVLNNEYLKLEAKNQTTFYITYDPIHAVSDKKEIKKDADRGSVGFG